MRLPLRFSARYDKIIAETLIKGRMAPPEGGHFCYNRLCFIKISAFAQQTHYWRKPKMKLVKTVDAVGHMLDTQKLIVQ